MNPRNLFFAVASVIVMGAAFTLMSQGLTDGVKVTLPYPVTVGDVVLDPGEYEIRRPSQTNDQILRFYSNDKLRYQTVVQTIPAEDKERERESKIILHHIGDKYYFDKIWMEDRSFGYEFALPDRVRALQRELAVTVPAQAFPAAQGSSPEPIPAAAAVQDSKSTAADLPSPDPEEPNRAEIRPAGSVAQGVTTSERQPDLVAAVQGNEQRQALPSAGVDARQDTQNERRPENDELPATASDWLIFVLGGGLLLVMSASLRPARARG